MAMYNYFTCVYTLQNVTVARELESADLTLTLEEIVVVEGYTKTFLVLGIGKTIWP